MFTVMVDVISQQLVPASKPLSHEFKLKQGKFKLTLHWDAEISEKASKKLFQETIKFIEETLRKNPHLKPEQIHRIVKGGILGRDEKPIAQPGPAKETAEKCGRFWDKASKILDKGRVSVPLPDASQADKEEPPIHHAGIGKADFTNKTEPHYLDGIEYPRIVRRADENDANFIRRCARNDLESANIPYDPQKKKVRETLQGVHLSIPKRSNYQMAIGLEGSMQPFFGRDRFTSTEVLGKNGIGPGGISASSNSYSDRVNLLRSVESEDGSVDSLAGRVQNLNQAKELAAFAFLSQMNNYRNPDTRHLAQGIVPKSDDDEYEFTFMAQSLLPMSIGEETEMVHKEIEAYKQLEELTRKGPLEIKDPADSSKKYQVRFRPLPVAATQFNGLTRLEALFPEVITGELEAREQSDLADEALFSIAKEKLAGGDLYIGEKEGKWISDSVYFLKNKKKLKPWQEIMVRTFLLHLLNIPLVVHCKHCVDRTNVVNAMSTAMKQWLRAGKELPQIDGKTAIFELPNVPVSEGADVFPFKELLAFNLHKGLKVTEWARGEKGYKYHRGIQQTPSFVDLLPERYLKQNSANWKKWAVCVIPVALLISLGWIVSIGALAYRILTSPIKSLKSPLKTGKRIGEVLLMPLKFIWNIGYLFPKKTIDENYELVGPRQFLKT